MGAKDCLPPGVKVIRVSGRVAKLTFDRWSNAKFEQSLFRWLKRESFQRLLTFYSASVKIRRQAKTTEGKIYYRPCSTRNFEATGATGENLRPFSFGGLDRLLRESTQPWLVYRGSKPVPQKLTGMAVNRLKDHTGRKKTLN